MGEVVEIGSPGHLLKKDDRVIVPFSTNCGECRMGNWTSCQRSNRNAGMAAKEFGHPTAGPFG